MARSRSRKPRGGSTLSKGGPIKHKPRARNRLPELPIGRLRQAIGGNKYALLGIDPNHPRMVRIREEIGALIAHLGSRDNITHPMAATSWASATPSTRRTSALRRSRRGRTRSSGLIRGAVHHLRAHEVAAGCVAPDP